MEINKGRANAILTVGRFFLYLKNKAEYDLIDMTGGVKDNVIPKNASVKILTQDTENLCKAVSDFNAILKAEYGVSDPNVQLVLAVKENTSANVLTEQAKEKAVTALNLMPNGVQAMSSDLPELVETSLNMGVLKLDEKELSVSFSVRSSLESAKEFLGAKLTQITEVLGGKVSFHGQYPGWPYARKSKLRDLCVKVYEKQYGITPKIDVIHAGLECGILASKIEGLDCISIGPNMADIHTPDERISISSIARVWEFIKGVLAE